MDGAKVALAIIGAWFAFKLGKAVNEGEWRELLGLDEPEWKVGTFEDAQRDVSMWQ